MFQKQTEKAHAALCWVFPNFIGFILLQLQKTHLNYETSLAWIPYIDETELTSSGEPECY